MKVLVVDDERAARSRLLRMLGALGVHDVLEAGSGPEALAMVSRDRPDVLLLDISMPGMSGLTVARLVEDGPAVVFVTAHDQHALEAFDVEAVDFLVKPVRAERLARALERVAERTLRTAPEGDAPTRISARHGDGHHLFDARRIPRFTATDKYVTFTVDGREYLLDESLTSLESRLGTHGFVRCHRAELVQLARVTSLESDEAGAVVALDDGQRVRVSRRLVGSLRARLLGGPDPR